MLREAPKPDVAHPRGQDGPEQVTALSPGAEAQWTQGQRRARLAA